MMFDFGDIIAHAAKTRPLSAGSIVGSGTVSNKGENCPGRAVADGGVGYSCILEQRTVEKLLSGESSTKFMKVGDTVLYSEYGGTEVKYSGQEYLLLNARDILAVVTK